MCLPDAGNLIRAVEADLNHGAPLACSSIVFISKHMLKLKGLLSPPQNTFVLKGTVQRDFLQYLQFIHQLKPSGPLNSG